ncbi:hypothetical protein GCM10020000_19370 [Streptomyces olivoverticillatus]
MTQVERKQYLAYRRLENFACVGRTQQREVVVYLKADPDAVDLVPGFTRDVREIGHHGTGGAGSAPAIRGGPGARRRPVPAELRGRVGPTLGLLTAFCGPGEGYRW